MAIEEVNQTTRRIIRVSLMGKQQVQTAQVLYPGRRPMSQVKCRATESCGQDDSRV